MIQLAKTLFLYLTIVPLTLLSQSDTISIYYSIDSYTASEEEKRKVEISIDRIKKIEVLSYTDYLGSTAYNLILSKKRAYGIKAFLLEKGIDSSKINHIIGKGEIGKELAFKEGVAENRRSDVILHYKQANIQDKEPEEPKANLADKIKESKVGSKLILKNLSFVPGHHYLLKESLPTLDSLILILQNNPNLKIEIQGHVCCSPGNSDGFDQQLKTFNLSEERAKHIYQKLIDNEIEPKRLSYIGLAKTQPLFPAERTPTEQQANRRVEIRIIEK